MMNLDGILDKLDGEQENSHVKRVKELLNHKDSRLLANKNTKVTVSEALRLWSTRVQNTQITGQKLEGAAALLTRLQGLAKQRKLEQFAVVGTQSAANLFFDGSTLHFVGAVIVDSHKKLGNRRPR